MNIKLEEGQRAVAFDYYFFLGAKRRLCIFGNSRLRGSSHAL